MNLFVNVALIGYFPVAVFLFGLLPVRRAVLTAYLIGWLFLPIAAIHLPGIPEYSKVSAPALACLAGATIFHSGAMLRLRPTLLDLPIAMFCFSPMLTNTLGDSGAGLYEGVATSVTQLFMWGVPWLMARAYFTDVAAARDVVMAIIAGALVYVPLCLIEIKFSPQLHNWVYGFHQHAFNQTRRLGGWRPMVFMQHGLALGLWMTVAALGAICMFLASRSRRDLFPRMAWLPAGAVTALIVVTAILCKSTGALLLLAVGFGTLLLVRQLGVRWPLYLLIAIAPAYMVARTTTDVVLTPAVSAAGQLFGADRARSLATRLRNEQLIVNRALENPVLGWGGGGRYLVRDPDDPERILSVPDQFWVIVLGHGGLLALGSLVAVLLLPPLCFVRLCPAREIGSSAMAPLAVLAVTPVLFLLDCLMNAMMNPIFTLAGGTVASVVIAARATHRAATPLRTAAAGRSPGLAAARASTQAAHFPAPG